MIVYIAAALDRVPLLTDAIAGAVGELAGAPAQLTLSHHDPRFGPLVQDSTIAQISEAGVVVADLSGDRTRVLFEVGLAAGGKKPIVLVAEETTQVPYDLRERKVILTPGSPSEAFLAARFKDALREASPQFFQVTV